MVEEWNQEAVDRLVDAAQSLIFSTRDTRRVYPCVERAFPATSLTGFDFFGCHRIELAPDPEVKHFAPLAPYTGKAD